MLGQSKRDLAALKTYKSAKTPRPDRYFFEPKFLQKTIRPVVLTERSTQIEVFVRVLFSVRMRDQHPFCEKTMLQCIFRDRFLPRRRTRSSGPQGISTIGFDFP